jgi:ParB-like chromosome segregation protein Spo0J
MKGHDINKKLGMPGLKKFQLAKLRGAKYNPHAISEEALAGLTKSLERFGCVEPIVVNIRGGRNRIVGGHSRREGLLALGVTEAICVTVDLSDADEKLLNVALNNPQIQGEFTEALGPLIDKLRKDLGEDGALVDLRISALQTEIKRAGDTQAEDNIPEEQYGVFVECEDEAAQRKLFEQLQKKGHTCRLLTL